MEQTDQIVWLLQLISCQLIGIVLEMAVIGAVIVYWLKRNS